MNMVMEKIYELFGEYDLDRARYRILRKLKKEGGSTRRRTLQNATTGGGINADIFAGALTLMKLDGLVEIEDGQVTLTEAGQSAKPERAGNVPDWDDSGRRYTRPMPTG